MAEIVPDGRGFILEVDRRSPNGRKECVLAIPTSLAKASISGSESRGPEEKSDYQEAINEVESAQVAKRWVRAMMKYGVEARGRSSLVNSRFRCRIQHSMQHSMCSPRSAVA
jgi:hypothetical protein